MNTKDLWQALTSNPITEPYFDGVFSIDTLKLIKNKPELIICNTDPSDKPGEHWLLFFFYDNMVDFFDSLGKDIDSYGVEIVNFVKRFAEKYQQSKIRTQPENTDLCGYYCLFYALKRCKGKSMSDIIESMKTCTHVVNTVNKNFTFYKFHNDKFQCCTKC